MMFGRHWQVRQVRGSGLDAVWTLLFADACTRSRSAPRKWFSLERRRRGQLRSRWRRTSSKPTLYSITSSAVATASGEWLGRAPWRSLDDHELKSRRLLDRLGAFDDFVNVARRMPALIREARGVILEAIEFRAGYTCRVTPNSDEPTCRSDASRRHHAMSWQQSLRGPVRRNSG